MRAQDFVGWLVPACVIAVSISALFGDLDAGRYSHLWLPIAGLLFGSYLVRNLLVRRKEWLDSQRRATPQRPI